MIGFCTDSNSQLPATLAERYGIEVVPLTVLVDGVEHLEGVDLTADEFYARFADPTRPSPDVSTAAPAPGAFAAAYQRLAARGCTEILSVHIGSALSGTLNSARLGAQLADEAAGVPVRLVDSGAASFVIACCLWEAAEAVAAGASLEDAAAVAEAVTGRCGNVFVVGALDLARRGGRLAADDDADATPQADGIPVLSLVDGAMTPIGTATSPDEAADLMATHVEQAGGARLRVGVGVADAAAEPLGAALDERLRAAPNVVDLVRYRISPSVGVHTGPGTAGAVFYETA